MVIRIYNLETGENFKLDEDIQVMRLVLEQEMKKRNWKTKDCRVEVLDCQLPHPIEGGACKSSS